MEIDGKRVRFADPDQRRPYDLTVEGDVWRTSRMGDRNAAFVIDESRPLKRIDRTFRRDDRPDNPAETFLGIYRLDRDTLTMCHWSSPTERPDRFEARKNGGVVYVRSRKK